MDYQRIATLLGLAVVSYLLILAWNEDYGQRSSVETLPTVVESETQEVATIEEEVTVGDIVPSLEPSSSRNVVADDPKKIATNRLVSVTTDVFQIKIDKKGGDIVSGALPKYPDALDTPDIPFVVLDPRNAYSAQSGLIGKNGTDNSEGRPLFSAASSNYDLGDAKQLSVDLNLEQENGVNITKRFTFTEEDYLIRVEYIVNNQSAEDWQATLFAQIKRDSSDPVSAGSGVGLQPYTGGATFLPDAPYTKLSFDDVADESYKEKVDGGYMAMVQHYFVSAWVPSDDKSYTYQARKLRDQDIYLFGFTGPGWVVGPGQQDSIAADFYIGPKNQYRLAEIAEGLNLTVDYGFLWWLAQPLFSLLTFIQGYVSNWGLAIIILTIIVKTLLYPLSAASFRSMAKMRKLQPEMARLKDRFGDDKQQFSQAMMDLYKKEGANPLGGCFPMLLQMPVFLALYWSLMESVELRQAPFFLWIHDLSVMDPYFVLPILMGASMFATQLMQPEPPDPVQAKVFKMMPIMFTFFFLWFPSGLVLYWLVNNLLSILQQWYVYRKIENST
ncbi:MAG: membrane protein insertase YidC [Pseudomonadales bacterium]|jgi:YidC/Oxa1 family membrane protein insertase|nr:membrane protein insertase YidC [Pseudomonadales bacterium]|tara:strand:+ start:1408 stop:3075 length:1668 start_codon:yes stop_codon:yes gene_type:complete